MTCKILLVDDESAVLDGLRRTLRTRYALEFATSGKEALERLAADSTIGVCMSDMRMPEMDGVALLATIRERYPDVVRLMLTGNADQNTAVQAINQGQILSFLNKPCSAIALTRALDTAVRQRELITAEKELLERTLAGSVRTLIEILSGSQPQLFGRTLQLRGMVTELSPIFGGNAWRLGMAAMLLPIGWAAMPPSLVAKSAGGAPLTTEERASMDRVPAISAKLVNNIPRLEPIATILHLVAGSPPGGGDIQADVERDARILMISERLTRLCDGRAPGEADVNKLLAAPGGLDVEMLEELKGHLRTAAVAAGAASGGSAADAQAPEVMLQTPGQAKPDDVLAADLLFTDGRMALVHGTVLTSLQIELLETMYRLGRISGEFAVIRPAKEAAKAAAA